MKKKALALVLALALLVAGVVGGTLAWLTDQTDEVKNTFTVGDINIGLTETTADYKMVPGNTIAKDPTVTVEEGSDLSYVRMKVTFNNASKLMAMLPSADNLDYDTDAEVELVRKLSPILFLTNYTSTGYNV